jgi:hypothetical protein
MFCAAHVWRFYRNLIRCAVRTGLVGGACILITPFDVVVFASEVFHAVVVDDVGYGGACGINIIPAQKAYLIDERGCLGGRFYMLALRRPVIIEGDQVLIFDRGTK